MTQGDRLASAAAAVGDMLWRQVGGTFLAPGSTFSLAALALSAAVFAALLVIRRRRPVRLAVMRRVLLPRRLLATSSGRTDAAYFIGGILFAGLAIGWALLSADHVRAAVLARLGAPAAPWLPRWASMAVITAALFLAYEFAYWLDHCLKHKTPLLWHFHKVHHQAESLSLLTNGRVHPVDTIIFANIVAVVGGTAQALLVTLLGVPAEPLALGGTNLLVMLTAIGLTHLQHSHVWLDFGPVWSRRMLGPAHHQIHHSRAPVHYDCNLGNTIALFDRLFGTFHQPPPTRPATLRFGVEDGEIAPHGLRAALFQPFADAAREVWPKRQPAWRRRTCD